MEAFLIDCMFIIHHQSPRARADLRTHDSRHANPDVQSIESKRRVSVRVNTSTPPMAAWENYESSLNKSITTNTPPRAQDIEIPRWKAPALGLSTWGSNPKPLLFCFCFLCVQDVLVVCQVGLTTLPFLSCSGRKQSLFRLALLASGLCYMAYI